MHAKKTSIMNIEVSTSDTNQCMDLNWMVKLESRQLKLLRVQSDERIKQKIGLILNEKYQRSIID